MSTASQVVAGSARFSLLSEGLVRMEYSQEGRFEDRRSVRALARPEPIPFTSVAVKRGATVLRSKKLEIFYWPDGTPFSSENLDVRDIITGKSVWRPGQVDKRNLGGVHVSLDVMHRAYTPKEVHPATTAFHEVGDDFNFWSFKSEFTQEQMDRFRGMMPDEIIAAVPPESLPPRFKRLLKERAKYPPGILSRSGYFLYNDSATPLWDPATQWLALRPDPKALDYYLFYYRRDFAAAMADGRLLFGATPLPPRYSFGIWYSRADTMPEPELRDLVAEFGKRDLPLDVLVLDLNWHLNGWSGFDWNHDHIKDPDGFLRFLHDQRIYVTACTHPCGFSVRENRFEEFLKASGLACPPELREKGAYFEKYDLEDKKHSDAYMDVFHKPLQDQGIDFWFVDGPARGCAHIDRMFWTDFVHGEHIKRANPERRPMIMSRASGFGSQRYPFHFTGDTHSQWEVLACQVEHTLRAGHVGLSFMTHDIGGFMSPFEMTDPDLYCRWVQWGALSPVFRLHSGGKGERRPWFYGERALKSFRAAVKLRMEFLPYIYTMARLCHDTGMPLCRSNALAHPEWEEGYGIWDAYTFGDRLYVAPVVKPGDYRQVILPAGSWYCGNTLNRIVSDGITPFVQSAAIDRPAPHYHPAGSLMVKQPYARRAAVIPETLIVELYCGRLGAVDSFLLYEDDGISRDFERSAFFTTRFIFEEGEVPELTVEQPGGKFAAGRKPRVCKVIVYGSDAPEMKINGKQVGLRKDPGGRELFTETNV